MAMDKGPINDAHVLILPIEHYASGMHMPASAQAEAEAYLKALEACFAAQVASCHQQSDQWCTSWVS